MTDVRKEPFTDEGFDVFVALDDIEKYLCVGYYQGPRDFINVFLLSLVAADKETAGVSFAADDGKEVVGIEALSVFLIGLAQGPAQARVCQHVQLPAPCAANGASPLAAGPGLGLCYGRWPDQADRVRRLLIVDLNCIGPNK